MMTVRVVWPTPNTRASRGAMSFPATRYTHATAAPENTTQHKIRVQHVIENKKSVDLACNSFVATTKGEFVPRSTL